MTRIRTTTPSARFHENAEAVTQAFLELLHLGRQMGLLKVGTVCVDGTHIKANASRHKGVRYDRAGDLEQKLRQDIEELLAQADCAARRSHPGMGRDRRPGHQTRRRRRTPSDANQLSAAVCSVEESLGTVQRVLADGGSVNAEQIEAMGSTVDLYVAITSEDTSQCRYDYCPPKESRPRKGTDPRLAAMREKVTSEEGRRIYSRRACTVEPTFGTIKAVLGLRQSLMRGLERVRIERDLACLAYNMKRIWCLSKA